MSVYMIGTVSRNFEQKIGIRLYDTKTKEFKDCPIGGIVQYLESGKEVKNLGISNGEAICTNGTFDRYANVVLRIGVAGRSPLVIVKEYADNTYDVVNGQGEMARMGIQYLLRYEKTDGIANGRVMAASDGTPIIVPFTQGAEFEREKVVDAAEKIRKVEKRLRLLGNSSIDITNGEFKLLDRDMKNVIIPEGVVAIAEQAFLNVGDNVESIKFPSTLKVIRSFGLSGIKKITELHLPVGLEKIESNAFNLSSVKVVYLSPTVKELDIWAFKDVQKVVYYNRAQKEIIDKSKGLQSLQIKLLPWKGKV